MQSIADDSDKQYKIVTMVVPPGISAVTIQGYKLELVPAPELTEGCHTVQVPMNLVTELKSHRLMTRSEWALELEKQERLAKSLFRRPLTRSAYA